MIQDSSTICQNKDGKELCEIVETNDFRMYFIMPYTLQQLGDVSGKKVLDYIKAFNKVGFRLIDMNEPLPSEAQINLSPRISWLSKIPMFLFMELEK